MDLNPDYLIGGLGLAIVALAIWNIMLDRRLTKLLRGGKTQSLEETIHSLESETKSLGLFRTDMEKYLRNVEKRLTKALQGVGTVRFQAFKGGGEGGNQSFASAFVNEGGDGVIISSVYSRNLVGIYAKPLEKGSSRFELSQEEKDAVAKALQDIRN